MEKFYTLVTKIDYRISFEEQRKSWYIVYDIIQIIRWMKQNKIICPSYTMYVGICVKRVRLRAVFRNRALTVLLIWRGIGTEMCKKMFRIRLIELIFKSQDLILENNIFRNVFVLFWKILMLLQSAFQV